MHPCLLTAVDTRDHIHLIIGSNSLAGKRCAKSLETGARVKLIAPEGASFHYALQQRLEDKRIQWIKRDFEESDLSSQGREEVDGVVDAVFVTLGGKNPQNTHISSLCRRLRIPINVVDAPNLCSFTLLATHSDGPLQVGTTTSGKGCKLASRITREIASFLPSNLGQALERLGTMRIKMWEQDHAAEMSTDLEVEDEESGQNAKFNQLVLPDDIDAAKRRRMDWLSQICEYWPLRRLACISDEDIEAVLKSFASSDRPSLDPSVVDGRRLKGKVILAGTGPGNPDLLTIATRKAIQSADIVLADKLVPNAVMELVPRRAEVHIARKFPGNADKAQDEFLEIGLREVKNGKTVVRLKQGDPYVYGRGAEEFTFFRQHGFTPITLPGITSALSAPLFASIPATHRAVSDEVLICTGTGRKGAAPDPPPFVATRTVVFLMALHRLSALVESLVSTKKEWPGNCPCAVVERASCHDQRVIRTTLDYVCSAVEEEGSRPPGLLIVGHSCEVLEKVSQRWTVEEGFHGLDDLQATGLEVPPP